MAASINLMLKDDASPELQAVFWELIIQSHYKHNRTKNLVALIIRIGRLQQMSDKEIGDLLRKKLLVHYSKSHVRQLLPKSCKDQTKAHSWKRPIFASMTMQKALEEIDSK